MHAVEGRSWMDMSLGIAPDYKAQYQRHQICESTGLLERTRYSNTCVDSYIFLGNVALMLI